MMRLLHCFLKLSSWVMFFPIGPRVIMWLAKIIPIRSRFNALKVTNVCTLKTIKGVITVLPGVLLCSTPELFCTVQLALVHWEKNAAVGYSFADSFNNSILILEVVYLVHSLIQSVPVRLQTSTLHSLSALQPLSLWAYSIWIYHLLYLPIVLHIVGYHPPGFMFMLITISTCFTNAVCPLVWSKMNKKVVFPEETLILQPQQ